VLTLRHLDHQYGPIYSGPYDGPLTVTSLAGPYGHERFKVAPGETVNFMESLTNFGSHSVKITSIETDRVVTAIRWSVYKTVAGGTTYGVNTPWQEFPAIVPGNHGVIRLLVTIRRPINCDAVPQGPDGLFYYGVHVVQWESLLGSHTTWISFPENRAIQIC
jgi:hypothetical protein